MFLSSVHKEGLEARTLSNNDHTKCQRKAKLCLEPSTVLKPECSVNDKCHHCYHHLILASQSGKLTACTEKH